MVNQKQREEQEEQEVSKADNGRRGMRMKRVRRIKERRIKGMRMVFKVKELECFLPKHRLTVILGSDDLARCRAGKDDLNLC